MNELKNWLTLGPVAIRLGVLEGQLRRMCNRQEIPYSTLGTTRVIHVDHLEKVREACIRRGYLVRKPEHAAA